nr:ABC transporter permease subunit [Pseudonocardia sp. AL041005-10]
MRRSVLLPGGLLLGLLVALPVAGPLAGGDPLRVVAAPWSPPRPGLPWGADVLGRDVLARVLDGGTGPVTTAVAAALLATAIGTAGGLWVGWTGGRRARAVTALSDLLVAVPLLLLVLVAAVTLPGPAAVVVGTVVGGAPLTVRVVADATARARTAGHVEAALVHGERPVSVLLREVLPAHAPLVAADLAGRAVLALQLAAATSVLGFGPPPPAPDWAVMLRENLPGLTVNPAAVLAPAVALGTVATVLAVVSLRLVPARTGTTRVPGGPVPRGPGLTVRGLRVLDPDGRVVLDGPDLDAHPGEVVAVVGSSGSGKTTLLHAVLGTLPGDLRAVSGGVGWDGAPLPRGRRWRRRTLGLLGQDPALHPLRDARAQLPVPDPDAALRAVGLDPAAVGGCGPTGSPGARPAGSRSPGHWPATPPCSCSTSPPRASTPPRPPSSSSCCAPAAASPSSSPTTRPSPRSPTGSCGWAPPRRRRPRPVRRRPGPEHGRRPPRHRSSTRGTSPRPSPGPPRTWTSPCGPAG